MECARSPAREGESSSPVPIMSDFYRWLIRGDGYQITSGPIVVLSGWFWLYANLRKHNCHAKRCWRIGRHPVGGTTYIVCRKHHPDEKPTAEQIIAEHDKGDNT